MDIGRTEGVGGLGRVEGTPRPPHIKPPTEAGKAADRVEVSETARLVSEALSLPDTRQDRIEELKKLIESGTFDTSERLDGAIRRFMEENRDLVL